MYPDMDLGLQGLFDNLKGWGLNENEANQGTALVAPLAYDRREQALKKFATSGFPQMQEPEKPSPMDQPIDLSFKYAGFPQMAQTNAAQGFPEPAVQLNPTPMPEPKPAPAPAPQGGGEDLEIRPRKELGPQGPLTPIYTPQDQGIDFTASGKPYQMAAGERKYQGPGNLADAIAAASWSARTGRPREEYFAEKGYNMAAGRMAPQNIVQRAAGGNDRQASDMLWLMVGKDPQAYARAVGGGQLPFQIEDQQRADAAALEQARYDMQRQKLNADIGFRERGLTEQGRQFDVNADLKRAQQTLDSAFQNKQIDLQTYQAQTARNAAEANARNQSRGLDLQATDPNRLLGMEKVRAVQEATAAAPEGQMSPVRAAMLGLPTANEQEKQALEMELLRKQAGAQGQAIDRAASGQMDPAQQRAAGKAAMNRAQALLDADPTMAPEEATRRAAQETGVAPESVPVPQYGTSVGSYQRAFQAAGFQSAQHAMQQVVSQLVEANPGAAGDPATFMQRMGPEILKSLIQAGVPAQAAAKAVAQEARKPR